MFMLRCAFWLSVMIASLPAGANALRGWRTDLVPVAASADGSVLARAETWCGARAALCVRDAGRLTALVAAAAIDPADAAAASIRAACGVTHRGTVPSRRC